MKILLMTLLAMVVFFLIRSAMGLLYKSPDEPDRVVKNLSWRIAISVVCLLVILGAQAMGWLQPSSSLQYLYQPAQ